MKNIIYLFLLLNVSYAVSGQNGNSELEPKIGNQLMFPKLDLSTPEKCRDSVDYGFAKNSQFSICDSLELNELDKELNKSYSNLSKKIDTKSKTELVKSQRTWLKYREEWCTFHKVDDRSAPGPEGRYQGCLIELTKTKIKEFNDLSFY